jgi:hypothetical protein
VRKAPVRPPDVLEASLQQKVVVEGDHEILRPEIAREFDVGLGKLIPLRRRYVQDPANAPAQEKLVPVAVLGPSVGAENAESVTVVQIGGELLDVDLCGFGSASRLHELQISRNRSMEVSLGSVEGNEIREDEIEQLIG